MPELQELLECPEYESFDAYYEKRFQTHLLYNIWLKLEENRVILQAILDTQNGG